MAELTSKNDGASFNLFKGDLAGTPHYAVSVFPERGEVIQGQATPEHIAAFVEKNQDLLQDPKNSIGTWFNKADGKTYLDISVTTPDIKEAATLGKANNQLAIFDLGNFQEISLQPHPSAEFTPVGEEAAYARPQFKDPMEGIRDKIAQSGGRDLARVAREQKARGIETGQQPPGQVPVQMQDPNGPLNVYKPGYEEAVKQRQAMRAGELSKDVIDLNGPQDKPKRLPSGLATAGLVAGPGVAAAIPDDPDSNLDDYGRVGINILAGAGILAASVRGRQVKNLSPIQDAAAKGAAALWMGGKKAWAQAVGEHRSPKLLAASQKLLDRHIQSTVNELPTTKKLLAMAKQGVTDHDWYDKTEVELQKMFGKDAQLMANLFAATSNNATVMSNASLALKAYRQIKTGEPITGFLPDVIENIKRAAAGQPLNGRKIDNFAKAMSGDPDAVVVDRWIMRAFGFNKGSAPTETQYDFMENAIRNLAQKAGQTPRQFQAALWFAYKNAAEAGKKRPPSPAPEGAIKRSIDIRHGEALRENRKFDKEKAKGPQLPFASGQ